MLIFKTMKLFSRLFLSLFVITLFFTTQNTSKKTIVREISVDHTVILLKNKTSFSPATSATQLILTVGTKEKRIFSDFCHLPDLSSPESNYLRQVSCFPFLICSSGGLPPNRPLFLLTRSILC